MRQRLYITTEEYFALPYASNSGIKDAHKLMNGQEVQHDGPKSAAYRFGSVFDAIRTDPTLVNTLDLPDTERKIIIPMLRSLEKNATFQGLFAPEPPHVPKERRYRDTQTVWVDTEFPVCLDGLDVVIPAKSKFDLWNSKVNFGADIKTTDARDLPAFISASKWFNYDQQAAWYMDISGSDRFVILGVSKWNYKVFEIAIKRGDAQYESGKQKYLSQVGSWWMLNCAAA